MPTLVVDNVPESLFERIQHLARVRRQKPAETVVDVLEHALPPTAAACATRPLPQEPFLTEEIVAPCSIPRPAGQRVFPVHIVDYVPKPHDLPDGE